MRSIWKGSINFGMVAIPARLYTATDDKRVGLHQYHAECGSRIQMPKWCPNCQRKLEAQEIRNEPMKGLCPFDRADVGRPVKFWIRPELKCEVKYLELSPDGKLRFPTFRKLVKGV